MLARAYSVKIGVIFDIRFERRKVDKKANLHENETCTLYTRDCWMCLPNVMEIDHYNSKLYSFKVCAFLRHNVVRK